MTADRRSSRRGYSLIEMVLVIGALSILLMLCAGMLHTLLRLDRAGRDSFHDATTLARLSRQFRQDVRSSHAAKPEAKTLELTRADGPSLTYRVDEGRLVREERDGKTVRRRESYAVQRLAPVTFATDGAIVRLVLSRHPSNPYSPARPAVGVEARLDKDRNLSADRAEARK